MTASAPRPGRKSRGPRVPTDREYDRRCLFCGLLSLDVQLEPRFDRCVCINCVPLISDVFEYESDKRQPPEKPLRPHQRCLACGAKSDLVTGVAAAICRSCYRLGRSVGVAASERALRVARSRATALQRSRGEQLARL